MPPFVGRQPELALLRARLAAALAGQPQVVRIQGPAGIGKTALIEHFLRDPGPLPAPVVVRASGEETEALLAYGVVEQLARSAGMPGAGLLSAVPGGAPAPVHDPVTVGSRILELLDGLDAASGVVLVVDDVHWADLPSVQALVFALRRLVADPVLTLLAVRDDADVELPETLRRLVSGHLGSVLRLRGLDEQDLRDLAAELGVDGFEMPAAQRLRYGTQGNPLHAKALLEEFPPTEWGPAEHPLPPPRSFRLLVADRYRGRAAGTRRLIDAAAVLGPHCPLPLAATLAEVEQPLEAVDEATRHGLLLVSEAQQPWTLAFPHPLVRAAVHDGLGPARRHALHLAAAGLVRDRAGALRHRVAAAAEPDEGLATDLTAFADAEARRQAWQSAAAHLVHASRLSPDPEEARRRVLRAVVWTVLRGDASTAASFRAEIGSFPRGPLRDAVLGSMATAANDPATAERLLAAAWQEQGTGLDPEVSATIALLTGIHHFGRLDAAATVDWCRRALTCTTPRTALHATAQTYLLHGLGYAGQVVESFGTAAAAEEQPGEPDRLWLNPRSARGVLRLVEDDLAGARDDLASVAATALQLGILNTAAFGFAYLARAEYVAGRWDDALVHAERAVAINLESDLGFLQSAVVGIAVLVPAGRGDWATAENHIAAMARQSGDGSGPRYERSELALGMARARLGEARGDPAAVVAALQPVREFRHRDAADEPGFWPWQDLYADGLLGVGRAEEADAFLVPHERLARERGRRSAIARLARVRARVEAAAGRPARAEQAFADALAATEAVELPFERGRIELAAGGFLRRAGQRRRAAELLSAAERRFTELGAAPYAERCVKEMAASGLKPAARHGRDRAELTAQELVVARLAAEGRSNREIADELVVSIKTIEYHLRNGFQKLDVTSRRQLAGRLGAAVE
jgi:ATP/maltotriose-dependent transcriptional regulator MalT